MTDIDNPTTALPPTPAPVPVATGKPQMPKSGWNLDPEGRGYLKINPTGNSPWIAVDDLKAWEKRNHDKLRGVKLNARCEAAYAELTAEDTGDPSSLADDSAAAAEVVHG